jgi:hypothetical protein
MVTNPFGYYQCVESMVIFGNGNIVLEVKGKYDSLGGKNPKGYIWIYKFPSR